MRAAEYRQIYYIIINPSRNFCSNPPKMYLSALLSSITAETLSRSLGVSEEQMSFSCAQKQPTRHTNFPFIGFPLLWQRMRRENSVRFLFSRESGRAYKMRALSVDVSRLYPSHSELCGCVCPEVRQTCLCSE